MRDKKEGAVLRTLLVSDLVDSTKLTEELGDERMAEIFSRHDRLTRDLIHKHAGREVDRTDGFFVLFDRPVDAVVFAMAFHRAMERLSAEEDVRLLFRVGIHLGAPAHSFATSASDA